MKTRFRDTGFAAAEKKLGRVGLEITRGSAAVGQQVAQAEARVDKGTMRRGIILVPTPAGADVVATDPKTIFHEYGTRYMSAQPMVRPGFDAGVEHFRKEAKRRGLA